MKRIKITTPENIEVDYLLANIGSRAAAAMIDTLIQFALILLIAIAVILMYNCIPAFWYAYMGWIIGIFLILSAIIIYGYYVILELNMDGMTFGKKLLKIRVIRTNGQPITLQHSAIRNLFKLFVDSYGIGFICILFSKEHKRLGDFASSTIVITEQFITKPGDFITLESLSNQLYYYLTPEEQSIINDYLSRKKFLHNDEGLKQELKLYFSNKFEALGILSEGENFINGL